VKLASDGNIEITYQCKACNKTVTLILAEQEWTELKNGYPFDAVFAGRDDSFKYFKLGVCRNHE